MCEPRVHHQYLLQPFGSPVTEFSCIQEFISIFINIIHGEYIHSFCDALLIFSPQFTNFLSQSVAPCIVMLVSTMFSNTPALSLGPPLQKMKKSMNVSSQHVTSITDYLSTLIMLCCWIQSTMKCRLANEQFVFFR